MLISHYDKRIAQMSKNGLFKAKKPKHIFWQKEG